MVGLYRNRQTGETRVFHDDVVVRRLQEEHPRLRASFDAAFSKDVQDISREIALATSLVEIGQENTVLADDAAVLRRLGAIMTNAADSIIGALELVRDGYGLQAGILLRSVLEAVAVVIDVVLNESSLVRFRAHSYSPTGAASRASRVFRIVGPLYGALSNHHTHVNKSHEVEYALDSTGEPARASLRVIKAATALVGLSVELLFQRSVAEPRYWKRRSDGALRFAPDPDELTILKDFPRLCTDEATGGGVQLTWTDSPGA